MEWRLIQDDYHDAYTNMAIDEVLLQSNTPVLRFYRWRPPAISIGYFQKLEKEIDLEECRRRGIDYVRRITGGKAVLHDKELTYSFIVSQDLMPKSITESYKVISRAILTALENLGLEAEMSEKVKRTQKSSFCFNDPFYYEIVVNGKKIVGSAQVRKNGKLLQHGSILIDFDIEKMCSLFKGGGKISQVQEKVTSLNNEPRTFKHGQKMNPAPLSKKKELNIKRCGVNTKKVRGELGKRIEFEDLALALKKGFEENFNVRLIPDELTRKEKILAQEIAAAKFSTREWNYLR